MKFAPIMIRQAIARVLCFITIVLISNITFSRACETKSYSGKYKIEKRFYENDYLIKKSPFSNATESYFLEENNEDNDDDSTVSYVFHYEKIDEFRLKKNSSNLLEKEFFKFACFHKIPRWLLIRRINI